MTREHAEEIVRALDRWFDAKMSDKEVGAPHAVSQAEKKLIELLTDEDDK